MSSAVTRKLITRYLVIDSGDRDRSLYPNPNNYRIHLDEKVGTIYKNIDSISLFSGIFPHQGNITQEPYLLLHVNELTGGTFDASNVHADNAFAIIQLDKPIESGYFLNIKPDTRSFILPSGFLNLTTLATLTISILDKDGNLFNFGNDDAPPSNARKELQHTLVFEIKCWENVLHR